MIPDIKTAIIFSSAIVIFTGFALLVYQANQKTYQGFGFWIISTLVLSFAYLFLFVRDLMPVWINIMISSLAFLMAAVLKWEGVRRFINYKKLPSTIYIGPFFILGIMGYFYFVENSIIIRGFVFSFAIFAVSLMIVREFFTAGTVAKDIIFKAAGLFFFLYGTTIMSRGLIWLIYPSSTVFNAGMIHGIYYIIVTLLELALGISFFMMNSQRLELELKQSEKSLSESVQKLEKALSDIKTLSGMLPICASCKKIRDDKGYWNQIETYIEKHSQALFSHGICPECAEELYKDSKWYRNARKELK